MKAIPITFDERLLEKLDSDDEVKREGRFAVIRRAVAEYLRKKRRATIADAYRHAYGKRPLESDLSGWTGKGIDQTNSEFRSYPEVEWVRLSRYLGHLAGEEKTRAIPSSSGLRFTRRSRSD